MSGIHTAEFTVETPGRSLIDISAGVRRHCAASGIGDGLCTLFVHHTSASLIVSENADPAVLRDLETYIADLVRDGDPRFEHRDEGPDDMSAHLRSVLTLTSLGLPMRAGELDLGCWQGIYLWEHRSAPHQRRLTLTIIGR